MKAERGFGPLAAIAVCSVILALPAAAFAGSIDGTVKSAATGNGIEGIFVCAHSPNFGLNGGCDGTDAEGKYKIEGLQPSPYVVAFEDEGRHNYLAQWYPGKASVEEAESVVVGTGGEVTGIDAVLQVGGQITGTVTDVEGGEPIEGIKICARQIDRVTEFGPIPCDKSAPDGTYAVWALPTGQFKLDFGPAVFSRGAPNYIHQYYPGKSSWMEAGVFAVTAGATYPDVDAAMQRGIGIAGTVTEVGGGPAGSYPRICADDAGTEVIVQCTGLETDGTYWIPGLPFGAYKVSFAVDVEEEPGLILHPDGFVRQYYNGKPTFGEADVLGSAGPTIFSGIDAQLLRGPEVFPSRSPLVPGPSVVTPIERPSTLTIRCRKGFRKKWIKGKRHCVKIHKKRRHAYRHGPHVHANRLSMGMPPE